MTQTAERKAEYQRRYYAENREKIKAQVSSYRRANLERVKLAEIERKYGLDMFAYYRLVMKQGDACRICRREERATRRGRPTQLSVDHDHTTGRVRGLLCADCNRAIGLFDDDPDRLEAAAAYLRGHAR